ncbi:MAG: hypothetical protein A3B74_04925 [Candidatus Kerfeldbacteria bacterium RIFCSPHIGHO2_02_FULL_42_14]|uniref:Glycosyl transferase family 1 domain-containing protein n=1 Tax=Candidatus Kerfeldbacteria bacterium RIFCSPHIGHO2_02_FULL_42_14 TaxID=1798540 RepID=A0A1G2AP61_9BACT|nr:MAG: hypothetical protein A3B74_04925 [Candidatus Kerfeldbacteria bacterium RIFCSPHIGHO2_02_FULL_42_14]OGY81064.1 MAG: hypothetical protein A3E60_03645 [Candidatus Kerfeldbacteria bacterium RIFCSPHIGHO2_12_FULL_42_13]OGY84882.1 MAG: hypothetical protein A3I91_05290 [Candidatus Kerfeldbacteria bacterium RIFCSPLOWO2_02_FULL_42_19]OGY86795.1 MAG: hypothetical protein A3G01_02590 [Candidatus Kerfeldbacteria bacterium RIFCSPLOWO2_12_FULL_43_9]
MRIGIDIRPLLEPYPSGIVLYTMELVRHLVEVDTENEYLLFYNAFQKNYRLLELKKIFEKQHVHIMPFSLPNKIFNSAQIFFGFPAIDTMIGGVDVFFAPNWGFMSVSRKCRFVVTAHDLATRLYPQFLSLKGKLWHACIRPKHFFQRADHIIAVSYHTKKDLITEYQIPEAKISVIYSGADHLKITHEALQDGKSLVEDGIQKKYKLPKHYVLMFGAEHPRKNFEAVCEAFQRLQHTASITKLYPNLTLVVIGKLPQKYKHSIPWVQCIGYIPEQDKYSLYRRAHILMYPSYYEGFGFPPLEAALAGTPAIVSCVSALPEVMDRSAVYVQPYHVAHIHNALELLLTNGEMRNTLITRGRRLAKQFTWQDTAQKTRNILEYAYRH